MTDPAPAETGPEAPEQRRASVLPWILLVVLAIGSSLFATWAFIDRGGVVDEAEAAAAEAARLRETVLDAEARILELQASLEEQRGEAVRRGDTIASCREALERISAVWNAVAGAMAAAEDLDAGEARSFARRAEEQRRAALRAARRCS